MSDKPANGPAFPYETEEMTYPGMMLRDYFAAKALPAAMTAIWRDIGYEPQDGFSDMQQHARIAYQMADAMLKERKK